MGKLSRFLERLKREGRSLLNSYRGSYNVRTRMDLEDPKASYQEWFREHLKCTFTEEDILAYTRKFHTLFEFIRSKIDLFPEQRILEVGSGIGGLYALLPYKQNYLGIELDAEAVEFAKQHFKSDRFKMMALEEMEGKGEFDLILAIEVLEHLYSPIDAIKKIYQLLSEGGVFCGTSPYPYKKNILVEDTHLFVLHPLNWKRLFENCGFNEVEIYPMSFPPLLWRINKELNVRLPFYVHPFKHVGTTSLIIARK